MTHYVLRSQRGARSTKLNLEADLNEQQRTVVLAPAGPLLVIAGAGTGKTRTLTYRAAHLLGQGLSPDHLLLWTFTNRAAKEMVRRVEQLLGQRIRLPWAGTFHHVANLALRHHADRVGLPHNYAILDGEDARDLMALCITEEGKLLRKRAFPKAPLLMHLLSRAVDGQLGLEQAAAIHAPRFLPLLDDIRRVIDRFTRRKLQLGLVDYDDLLLLFKVLLVEHPGPAEQLTSQFRQVLVDEYQDTSGLQGEIIDLCVAQHHNLTVVGDDAQSIYSFRGADFRNILEFPRRYPEAQVHRLEINYRSTPEVLALANRSIARNRHQHPKQLRAVHGPDMMPALIPLHDVYQQAEFVAQRVLELSQEEAVPLSRIGVLYRAHAHSLELQVELSRRDIPFAVRSGLRFFEQAHVKDVTAYLRLTHNSTDELAWHRVLRLWPGVGARTASSVVQAVQEAADRRTGGGAAIPAAELLASDALLQRLPGSARASIGRLARLFHQLSAPPTGPQVQGEGPSVQEMIELVLDGHYAEYASTAFPNPDVRVADLKQFAQFAGRFPDLEQFLSDLALVANVAAEAVGPGELPDETLTLTTVHQAKGLEWQVVFILWLADGRFPQALAIRTEAEEEEERRLFHVAVTRAEKQLYLCHPLFEEPAQGSRHMLRLSRFLAELDGPDSPPYERWTITEEPEGALS